MKVIEVRNVRAKRQHKPAERIQDCCLDGRGLVEDKVIREDESILGVDSRTHANAAGRKLALGGNVQTYREHDRYIGLSGGHGDLLGASRITLDVGFRRRKNRAGFAHNEATTYAWRNSKSDRRS